MTTEMIQEILSEVTKKNSMCQEKDLLIKQHIHIQYELREQDD